MGQINSARATSESGLRLDPNHGHGPCPLLSRARRRLAEFEELRERHPELVAFYYCGATTRTGNLCRCAPRSMPVPRGTQYGAADSAGEGRHRGVQPAPRRCAAGHSHAPGSITPCAVNCCAVYG